MSDLIKQMLINHLAKPRDCLVHVGHYENASRLESALIKPITDCCVIQAAFTDAVQIIVGWLKMLIYINQIEMPMGGRKLKNPANKGTLTQNLCPTKSLFCLLVFGLITSICRSYRNTFEAHLRILRWKAEGKLQNVSLSY